MNIRLLMIALLAIVCNTSKAQVDGSPLADYWDDDIKAYVISSYKGLSALQEINSNGSWSEYAGVSIYIREGESDNFIESYNNDYGENGSSIADGEEGKDWIALGSEDNPFNNVQFFCRASHYYDFVAEGQGSGPLHAFGTDESGNYGDGSDDSPFLITSPEDIHALIELLKFLYIDSYAFTYYAELETASLDSGPFYDMSFRQTTDIELNTISEGIGTSDYQFCGTYDGDGNNITVNVEANSEYGTVYGALFNQTKNATIKNLSITGINSDEYTNGTSAGIIGCALENIELNNCIINVKVNSNYLKYGLIGSCEPSNTIIKDCFNKGAVDLEQFPGSADYHKEQYTESFSWTSAIGEGTHDCPLKLSSLQELKDLSDDEDAKPWIEEYGLCYELTGDCNLLENMLVTPNGRYTNPDGVTNNDSYIEKFCGTLIGNYIYTDDSYYSSDEPNNVISGITDKALFGTITGDSWIRGIGFVNCYNADNNKVCIANEVSNGSTLTIWDCYSDGYFDFKNSDGTSNTLDANCYSRSYTPNPTIGNFGPSGGNKISVGIVSVETDEYGYNIVPSSSILTDAIPEPIETNYPRTLFMYDGSTPSDPRLKFKYNFVDENNTINILTLNDITLLDKEESATYYTDAEIKSTDFNLGIYSDYNIKGIRYLRKANNDWESVCLPFAYNLSDVDSHFKAYTYSVTETDGVTFSALPKDTEVAAGQPVLFFNSGKDENIDFVVSAYNSNGIEYVDEGTNKDGIFYGVLQTTGLERTGATKYFDDECYTTEDDLHYNMSVYKIAGAKTDDNGGELKQCQGTSWIYPYRTYLKLTSSDQAKSIRFSITDDNTTSIDAAELATKLITTDNIYSLDGRKVSAKGLNGLKAGLYIMNGKKFVVK